MCSHIKLHTGNKLFVNIIESESSISCNLNELKVKKGDVVFINGKELHSGTIRGYGSAYFCVQINTDFFNNLVGNEYVTFKNLIRDSECTSLLERIIDKALCENFKETVTMKKELYELFSQLQFPLLQIHTISSH